MGLPQPVRRGVDRQPGVAEPQRRLALVDGTSRPCDARLAFAPRPRDGHHQCLGQRHALMLAGAVGPEDREVEVRLGRSEEHTSELQSLMRISYAVFCLKKKKKNTVY